MASVLMTEESINQGVMADISCQIQSRLWGHFHGFHAFYGLFGRQASHNGHVFCTVLLIFFSQSPSRVVTIAQYSPIAESIDWPVNGATPSNVNTHNECMQRTSCLSSAEPYDGCDG